MEFGGVEVSGDAEQLFTRQHGEWKLDVVALFSVHDHKALFHRDLPASGNLVTLMSQPQM